MTERRQGAVLTIGSTNSFAPLPLPAEYRALAKILENVLDDLGRLYESLDRRFDDAVWMTYRFIEILPIDLEQKQRCLESSDTLARLKLVDELLHTVSS